MPPLPIPRRAFLLAPAALTACARPTPGTLAYIDLENLWLRDLPAGPPRRVATGHRLNGPKFSPSGRWIAFQDGLLVRVAPTQPDRAASRQWFASEIGEPPFTWIGHTDQLGVRIASPQTAEPGDTLTVFSPADHFQLPRWSLPLGLNTETSLAIATEAAHYAFSQTRPNGYFPDGVEKYQTSLILGSRNTASLNTAPARTLAQTDGFFDLAGFTPGGHWLLVWKSDEIGVAIQEDGLPFLAFNTATGQCFDPRLEVLVGDDMVAISPTSPVVAITSGSGRKTWSNKRITLLDFTGPTPTIRHLTPPFEAAQLPAWSPDGTKLAWCSAPAARSLQQRRICIADAAGNITASPAITGEAPVWSPNGTHILFGRIAPSSQVTLWLMRADGSSPQQVAGPLRPPPDLTESESFSYKFYYGHTDWRSLFDWR